MHPALTLAVYALAVARVTRLLVTDRILEAPRRWVVVRLWARTVPDDVVLARWPNAGDARAFARMLAGERWAADADPPLAPYLLTCPWCVSVYVGAAAAPAWFWAGSSPWFLVPAAALAFSYVTGFLASKEA